MSRVVSLLYVSFGQSPQTPLRNVYGRLPLSFPRTDQIAIYRADKDAAIQVAALLR